MVKGMLYKIQDNYLNQIIQYNIKTKLELHMDMKIKIYVSIRKNIAYDEIFCRHKIYNLKKKKNNHIQYKLDKKLLLDEKYFIVSKYFLLLIYSFKIYILIFYINKFYLYN